VRRSRTEVTRQSTSHATGLQIQRLAEEIATSAQGDLLAMTNSLVPGTERPRHNPQDIKLYGPTTTASISVPGSATIFRPANLPPR
jgi:hypothetical protein